MKPQRRQSLNPRRVNQAEELSPRDWAAAPLPVIVIQYHYSKPVVMSVVTLTAQCVDHLGRDQSHLIEWVNHGAPGVVAATGKQYRFAVDTPGEHVITARYTDAGGRTVTAQAVMTASGY